MRGRVRQPRDPAARGRATYYAHLSPGSGFPARGARVRCGQQIGRTGHSGQSTGPHLHFEVRDGVSSGSPYGGSHRDPYGGPCSSQPGTLWAGGGRNVPAAVCACAGGTEVCNGADDDCDGAVDEDCAAPDAGATTDAGATADAGATTDATNNEGDADWLDPDATVPDPEGGVPGHEEEMEPVEGGCQCGVPGGGRRAGGPAGALLALAALAATIARRRAARARSRR